MDFYKIVYGDYRLIAGERINSTYRSIYFSHDVDLYKELMRCLNSKEIICLDSFQHCLVQTQTNYEQPEETDKCYYVRERNNCEINNLTEFVLSKSRPQ